MMVLDALLIITSTLLCNVSDGSQDGNGMLECWRGGSLVAWAERGYPANTKHLYNICTMLDQRRRRWADVVQMLYKCFVFAG